METINDIIAELREHNEETLPPWVIFNEDGGLDVSLLADRIEAAYKKIMDVVEIAEIESNAIFQITAHSLIEKKSKKIYNACVSIINKENNHGKD